MSADAGQEAREDLSSGPIIVRDEHAARGRQLTHLVHLHCHA
jgi:hypothetical protein